MFLYAPPHAKDRCCMWYINNMKMWDFILLIIMINNDNYSSIIVITPRGCWPIVTNCTRGGLYDKKLTWIFGCIYYFLFILNSRETNIFLYFIFLSTEEPFRLEQDRWSNIPEASGVKSVSFPSLVRTFPYLFLRFFLCRRRDFRDGLLEGRQVSISIGFGVVCLC